MYEIRKGRNHKEIKDIVFVMRDIDVEGQRSDYVEIKLVVKKKV